MVPDRQKVRTDGGNRRTDDAKTISLRLHRGIIKDIPILVMKLTLISLSKENQVYFISGKVMNEINILFPSCDSLHSIHAVIHLWVLA